jgi:hypothetical protein
LCDGAGYDKDECNEESDDVDRFAAEQLRHWCEDERTDAKSNDEDGDGEKRNLFRNVEGSLDAFEVRCDDRGVEGDNEAGGSDNHGTPPLVCFAPILRVLWVVYLKCDEFVFFLLAGNTRDGSFWDNSVSCLLGILFHVGIIVE